MFARQLEGLWGVSWKGNQNEKEVDSGMELTGL